MGIESVKEMEELEKEGKKVIVEIGCGRNSFPLFGKRKLKEIEKYMLESMIVPDSYLIKFIKVK